MRIYDISVSLNENLPSWPGETGFSRKENQQNSITVSELSMSAHTGTHIDAPYHFLPEGKKISDYPPERFIGKARVCTISNKKSITLEELKTKNLSGVDKLLFKTKNSKLWDYSDFNYDFIGLEFSAAKYLVDIGIKLIGADYLSIEAYESAGNPVHQILLKNDILILEGLNLAEAPQGDYFLVSSPLKIDSAEAAPARVFLIEPDYEIKKNTIYNI